MSQLNEFGDDEVVGKPAKAMRVEYAQTGGGGWIVVSVRGSHVKLKHPYRKGHVIVPHPRKDIPIGTVRNIFRQVGWEWK